jgi:hypothetical protein
MGKTGRVSGARRALCIGACVVTMSPEPAAAAICAARPITATGTEATSRPRAEEASRNAWLRKVGRDRTLGPTYAVWSRAKDRRTVCRRIDTQTLCLAAAKPCRAA